MPHKASYFEYRLCHKIFDGKDRTWIIEINCTDDSYFLCDSVCTQSKKLYEGYPGSVWSGKLGRKMVYNFLGIDEKT